MKAKIILKFGKTEIIKSKKIKLTDDWVEFKNGKDLIAIVAMNQIAVIRVL